MPSALRRGVPIVLAGLLAWPTGALAQVDAGRIWYPADGGAIPGGGTLEIPVEVDLSFDVQDVVPVFSGTHGDLSELSVALRAPDGTTVSLMGVGDMSGETWTLTRFEDSATSFLFAAEAPYTGAFFPAAPLNAFNGLSARGTWTLLVTDAAGGADGAVLSAGLSFAAQDARVGIRRWFFLRDGDEVTDAALAGPSGVAPDFPLPEARTGSPLRLSAATRACAGGQPSAVDYLLSAGEAAFLQLRSEVGGGAGPSVSETCGGAGCTVAEGSLALDGAQSEILEPWVIELQADPGGQVAGFELSYLLDGADLDGDRVPDACDACLGPNLDSDGDGLPDCLDSCDGDDGEDADGDGIADACDLCPGDYDQRDGTGAARDRDGDRTPDACDPCPQLWGVSAGCGGNLSVLPSPEIPLEVAPGQSGDSRLRVPGCVFDASVVVALEFEADMGDTQVELVGPEGQSAELLAIPGEVGALRWVRFDDAADVAQGAIGEALVQGTVRPPGGVSLASLTSGRDAGGLWTLRVSVDGAASVPARLLRWALYVRGTQADAGEDSDSDGIVDACDGCPNQADPLQADADLDGAGDVCDPCAALAGQRWDFAGLPQAIPAGGELTVTTEASYATPYEVCDVDLSFDATHSHVGDLVAQLLGPGGERADLFAAPAQAGVDITGLRLDDEADATLASGQAPFSGAFQPSGSLGIFDAGIPDGEWSLGVADRFAARDDGTLESAALFIDARPAPPEPTLEDISIEVVAGERFSVSAAVSGGVDDGVFSSGGGPPWLRAGEGGALSGVAEGCGRFELELQVADGQGRTDSATVQVDVAGAGPLVFTPPALQQVQAGDFFGPLNPDVAGGCGDLSYTATGLPEGLQIDPESGAIGGSTGRCGRFAPVVTVRDSLGASVSASVPMNVASPSPVTVLPGVVPEAPIDDAYDYGVLVAGGCDLVRVEAEGLPPGIEAVLDVNLPGARLVGVAMGCGAYDVTLRAFDNVGGQGEESFSLVVGRRAETLFSGSVVGDDAPARAGLQATCEDQLSAEGAWRINGCGQGLSGAGARITRASEPVALREGLAIEAVYSVTAPASAGGVALFIIPDIPGIGADYLGDELDGLGYGRSAVGARPPFGFAVELDFANDSAGDRDFGPDDDHVAIDPPGNTAAFYGRSEEALPFDLDADGVARRARFELSDGPGDDYTVTVRLGASAEGAADQAVLTATVPQAALPEDQRWRFGISTSADDAAGMTVWLHEFHVEGGLPLRLASDTLEPARRGSLYDVALPLGGGCRPLSAAASGLPAGLALEPEESGSVRLVGTPESCGEFSVSLEAADAAAPAPQTLDSALGLSVRPPFIQRYFDTFDLPPTGITQSGVATWTSALRGVLLAGNATASGSFAVNAPFEIGDELTLTMDLRIDDVDAEGAVLFLLPDEPPFTASYLGDDGSGLGWATDAPPVTGLGLEVDLRASGAFDPALQHVALNRAGSVSQNFASAALPFRADAGQGRRYQLELTHAGAGVYDARVSVAATPDAPSVVLAEVTLPAGTLDPALRYRVGVSAAVADGVRSNITVEELEVRGVQSLALSTSQLTAGTLGLPYISLVSVSGGCPPHTLRLVGLPEGLSLDGNLVTGTPQACGSFTLAATAFSSGEDPDTATGVAAEIGLEIADDGTPLSLVTTALPSVQAGTLYEGGAIQVTGGCQPYDIDVVGLPIGLSALPDGRIIGLSNVVGEHTLSVTVRDNAGGEVMGDVSFAVTDGDIAVSIADLVGGGDGFFTGSESYRFVGLDPATGQFVVNDSTANRPVSGYRTVDAPGQADYDFIEGSFVVSGRFSNIINNALARYDLLPGDGGFAAEGYLLQAGEDLIVRGLGGVTLELAALATAMGPLRRVRGIVAAGDEEAGASAHIVFTAGDQIAQVIVARRVGAAEVFRADVPDGATHLTLINGASGVLRFEEIYVDAGGVDGDGDGVPDAFDDCPADISERYDNDGDGTCDNGDGDDDGDGLDDDVDPFPTDASNPADGDGDGAPDALDGCPTDPLDDRDGDGVCDGADPCPEDRLDDQDGDGACDSADPCPEDNPDDVDGDGSCDSVDPCPQDALDDRDGDGLCDSDDGCPDVADPEQPDQDVDGIGDACDPDRDGDGFEAAAGDCDDINPLVGPGVFERCDGIDWDCIGGPQNGFDVGASCVAGVGECRREGLVVCTEDGTGVRCDASPGAAAFESCNGLDDDCDGSVDEGFGLGEACEVGIGLCARSGVTVCDAGGVRCSAVAAAGEAELCDGIDNDCDGDTDEDFDDFDADGVPDCRDEDDDNDDVRDFLDAFPRDPLRQADRDGDGLADNEDLCPIDVLNDRDGDGACDSDDPCPDDSPDDPDGDGRCSSEDPCPQDRLDDRDGDGICDSDDLCPLDNPNDPDGDSVCSSADNCPEDANPDQGDSDDDGLGDACDVDADNDGVNADADCDDLDPLRAPGNPERCDDIDRDCDFDTDNGFDVGFVCEVGTGQCRAGGVLRCAPSGADVECTAQPLPSAAERCDGVDNDCDGETDEDFSDFDGDMIPDCRDDDDDNDGTPDDEDDFPTDPTRVRDRDRDGVDDSIDPCPDDPFDDQDGDGVCDSDDPCPRANPDDIDEDGLCGDVDNCPVDANPQQTDMDLDTIGDVCDDDADGDGDPRESDCDDRNASIHAGNTELCNGIDDNCDGTTDEGFALGDRCDVGTGACARTGVFVCDAPVGLAMCSVQEGTPVAELCDEIDNDCDGTTDEDFPDSDGDLLPDCRDNDDDNDGVPDALDSAPLDPRRSGDGDNDGVDDRDDVCPAVADPDQADANTDGCGDACQPSLTIDALTTGPRGDRLYAEVRTTPSGGGGVGQTALVITPGDESDVSLSEGCEFGDNFPEGSRLVLDAGALRDGQSHCGEGDAALSLAAGDCATAGVFSDSLNLYEGGRRYRAYSHICVKSGSGEQRYTLSIRSGPSDSPERLDYRRAIAPDVFDTRFDGIPGDSGREVQLPAELMPDVRYRLILGFGDGGCLPFYDDIVFRYASELVLRFEAPPMVNTQIFADLSVNVVDEGVELRWATLDETQLAGFRVLRRLDGAEEQNLTDPVLPPRGVGFLYRWVDRNAPAGLALYIIEGVRSDGLVVRSSSLSIEVPEPEPTPTPAPTEDGGGGGGGGGCASGGPSLPSLLWLPAMLLCLRRRRR